MYQKLKKLPSFVRRSLAIEPALQQLMHYFTANKQHGKNSNTLLIQAVEDPFYFALFGVIAQDVKRCGVGAECYLLRSMQVGELNTLVGFCLSRILSNRLANAKWKRVYASYCEKNGITAIGGNPFYFIADYMTARAIHKKLQTKNDVVQLNIQGYLVGDLIYDTYLRFKPAPTVDVRDPYLRILIWETLRLLRKSQLYFHNKKPAAYLSSYSTYIQHGIPVRVALANKIPVYTFGNLQTLYKKLGTEDDLHTANTEAYAKNFEALDNKQEKIEEAEAALSKRLGGGIDSATAYMKQSAYQQTVNDVPDVNGYVVIFLHDFYDSPHVYYDMVFPDFWEWIEFTIEYLRKAGIPFAIKPHPNQIALSDGALQALLNKYADVMVLNTKITNRQLVQAGVSCALTVYGTVAHEMAYMGVPTISCARHPHNSFHFCHNAKTVDEYTRLLSNAQHLPYDKAQMKYESLAFYYMHNLNKSDEEKEMMALVNRGRYLSGAGDVDWLKITSTWANNAAFNNEVAGLLQQ